MQGAIAESNAGAVAESLLGSQASAWEPEKHRGNVKDGVANPVPPCVQTLIVPTLRRGNSVCNAPALRGYGTLERLTLHSHAGAWER